MKPDLSGVKGVIYSPQKSLTIDGKKIFYKYQSGSDFHSIRDYVQDDSPKLINWSATAKLGRLMSNQYQPEKGKVLTILIDCGRLMAVEVGGKTRLIS